MEIKSYPSVLQFQKTIGASNNGNKTPLKQLQNSTEYMGSEISSAIKAYAVSQVKFGNKWEKVLRDIKTKNPNDVQLNYDEIATLLERLGFVLRKATNSSHRIFSLSNNPPITVNKPHGKHKSVHPNTIRDIHDFVIANHIQAV